MDDLYDEDFEDMVASEVLDREQPAAVGSKSEFSDALESNQYDDDFYSAQPSSAVEPLGPEATITSDAYEDDFYSVNPSVALDQRSTLTAEEPASTPSQTVQKLSDAFSNDVVNEAVETSSKFISNTISVPTEPLSVDEVPVSTIKSTSWDDIEAAADQRELNIIEPAQEHSLINGDVTNTEESVFYEDDFAVSVDDVVNTQTNLAADSVYDSPAAVTNIDAIHADNKPEETRRNGSDISHEPPHVTENQGESQEEEPEGAEIVPMISHKEPSDRSLHSHHSQHSQRSYHSQRSHHSAPAVATQADTEPTPVASARGVEVSPRSHPLREEPTIKPNYDRTVSADDAETGTNPTSNEKRASPVTTEQQDEISQLEAEHVHQTNNAHHTITTTSTDHNSIELYDEDFDVSISEQHVPSTLEVEVEVLEKKEEEEVSNEIEKEKTEEEPLKESVAVPVSVSNPDESSPAVVGTTEPGSALEFTPEEFPAFLEHTASQAPGEHMNSNQGEPTTITTDPDMELYNEDFDVSTSEKAAFSEREVSKKEENGGNETEEHVSLHASMPVESHKAVLAVVYEPVIDEPDMDPTVPEFQLPQSDAHNSATEESAAYPTDHHSTPRSTAFPHLVSSHDTTQTNTASSIDDLVLTSTNESAASLSAGIVGDIMHTASQKAFTALSPARQRVESGEKQSGMAIGMYGEGDYGSQDGFETLDEPAVLHVDTDTRVPIEAESSDTEPGSPLAGFVAATFLQAQANLSRPPSAASRDPALTNATLSDKMRVRPVSAKLAEALVERSVSQARVNVVMGSPTRSPVRGETVEVKQDKEEEPLHADHVSAEATVPTPVEVIVDPSSADTEGQQTETVAAPPQEPPEEMPTLTTETVDTLPSVLGIGESAMNGNDRLGSGSLVIEDGHSKSTKSIAYDDFLGTLGLATPSADSKKAAQLRALVSETRDTDDATAAAATVSVKKKLTKKEQQEADRTFLTSLQYHPPVQQTKKIVGSSSGPNLRPNSSKPAVPKAPVSTRDLLRARSAGPNRAPSPERPVPPPKAAVPKRKSLSPNRNKHAADHRTKFVAPPLCLPSQMLPKDLLDYLFATNQESELHIARFCQHGRHFDTCRVELCLDAYEKYRWLNLTHQKAKEACELVSDADRMWRDKLEKALVEEIQEKKTALEEELSQLSVQLTKKHNASVKLLKQGVRYYESILPALHKGKVTPQELHKATGWTEEHYEHHKKRLLSEEHQAHFKRKMKLDQQAHKNLEALEQLKTSLVSPMMYLDGMLKQRLEKIHSAVKRIDLCFQYSIKLAIGIGKGKSEDEIKAEKEARSPMRNAIVAERMVRNTKHGFEILKASLASIADVCSEVRIMYQGIKRDHGLKQEKRMHENANGEPRSRSASPARRSPSPDARRSKRHARPKSAPSNTSSSPPPRRKSARPKSNGRGRSATTRTERDPSPAVPHHSPHKQPSLDRASKISYGDDFESHSAIEDEQENQHDPLELAEDSIEIRDDTFDEQISDMMREMMGVPEEDEGDYSRRPSKTSKASRDRARSGSGSIVEDSISDSASTQRPHSSNGISSSKRNGGVRPFPSLTMSVGSGIDAFGSDVLPGHTVSEKGAVMARAKALALSRSPGGHNYAPDEGDEEGEIASEVDDDIGFSRDSHHNNNHHRVSVSNMYDDDFEGGSELLHGAFSGSQKNTSSKKHGSKKVKKKSTSQKVARLISTDPLGKPLANMKHTQMNDQSILHGILLSHNIPIHYTDEPEATASHKLKPLIITNNLNQPVVLSLSSPSKLTAVIAPRPKSAEPLRTSPLANPRASLIMASLRLPEKLSRGQIRCYHCGDLFYTADAKHIPTTAVSSDTTVFERAKVRQKETGKLFPTYDKLQVTSNSEVQKQWIIEQQEKQQTLVTTPKAGDHKKASTTLQRFEHPFCSWECVKAWIYVNYPPHQRYQYDILIDATAGHTVVARVC